MKLLVPALALALTALATTACDRPKTQGTAYNNTGNSASTAPERQPPSTTSSSDTASPGTSTTTTTTMAPGPTGDATGAVSETVTTGKIKAAIAADSGLKDSDISVTTNNGVVTLSGTVKSQDQIAIATNLAQRQDGVNRVESNIAVK